MPKEIAVKQGDSLIRIASSQGFGTWELIWNLPENESLRQRRSDPQVLYEGDTVVIPDKSMKVVSCSSDALHRFQLKGPKCFLRICLKDQWGKPFKDNAYEFSAGDRVWKGSTDTDGIASVAVPPTTTEGTLKFWPDPDNEDAFVTCTVMVGHLDPVSEITGVQGRLNNLGFSCGNEDGTIGEKTKLALRFFQLYSGHHDPKGELDGPTRQALLERHGNI
jgi:N-acetylmuramoyl-L-alanine amidase